MVIVDVPNLSISTVTQYKSDVLHAFPDPTEFNLFYCIWQWFSVACDIDWIEVIRCIARVAVVTRITEVLRDRWPTLRRVSSLEFQTESRHHFGSKDVANHLSWDVASKFYCYRLFVHRRITAWSTINYRHLLLVCTNHHSLCFCGCIEDEKCQQHTTRQNGKAPSLWNLSLHI